MMTLLILLILAFGGFTALLVLSISILEAPWPVLLGILVTGLVSIQWLSTQGRAIATSSMQPQGTPEHSSSSPNELSTNELNRELTHEPDLIYRGVHYTDHHHADILKGDEPSKTDTPQPEIIYRGQKVIRHSL